MTTLYQIVDDYSDEELPQKLAELEDKSILRAQDYEHMRLIKERLQVRSNRNDKSHGYKVGHGRTSPLYPT